MNEDALWLASRLVEKLSAVLAQLGPLELFLDEEAMKLLKRWQEENKGK